MTTYRQDLRDVPTQSDPIDIDWPVKPSRYYKLKGFNVIFNKRKIDAVS